MDETGASGAAGAPDTVPFPPGPALLFCPADRPDRHRKAAERADAVILDLEDAVLPADRPAARSAVRASRLDPARTLVRITPLEGPDAAADLDCVAAAGYDTIMVPKACDADAIAALPFRVVALCETAAGVVAAERIARQPNVVALMWGAEDLIASLGGSASRRADGGYRDVVASARSRVLIAAAAAGRAAIDTVHLDIDDAEGLAAEAEDAAASGFAASACIHPSQVPVIRRAYRPAPERVEWARAVLAAAGRERGVFRYAGAMVDEPVLRHARSVLARAAEPSPPDKIR